MYSNFTILLFYNHLNNQFFESDDKKKTKRSMIKANNVFFGLSTRFAANGAGRYGESKKIQMVGIMLNCLVPL